MVGYKNNIYILLNKFLFPFQSTKDMNVYTQEIWQWVQSPLKADVHVNKYS
jgi:hypothetical protein